MTDVAAPQREAGILLHPTSLPGNGPFGELGPEALQFVDFLAAAGQRLWQVLPLGPVHEDLSPYQALSAFAGNAELIGREWLLETLGGVNDEIRQESPHELIARHYRECLEKIEYRENFALFCRGQSHWLEDYALFRVLKDRHRQQAWNEWPVALRDRHPEALQTLAVEEEAALDHYRYQQYLFYQQWHRVRQYANAKGIRILGDMPIFVAYDSADVWANRDAFLLDEAGNPTVVAGVPPDYFSATGQRWGNPHYDWEWMEADGFRWWHQRVAQHLELFDLFRVDHFRGFEAGWEIPAHEPTAINGRWVEAPGDALFASLRRRFGELPIVAEDLGVITPAVTALRRRYHLPGMLILQFAFDSGPENPYLPHNHTEDSVVYTGTHDNNTTLGWYQALSPEQQQRVQEYLNFPQEPMPWALIECAYASVARQAIVPMQDVLGLGEEHRMNTPGVPQGNWRWRFQWGFLPDELSARLAGLVARYGRDH
ncbi:MAG: 4-alpha-glucanotransferase [Gammaproteobacteria bacterium]|nr:4-alpha-glucanotransferase [Gammaproteobacteria bacterium]MCW8958221.1 4-alpha-glucanotransferase [Gammaproteobacteria bacterium]